MTITVKELIAQLQKCDQDAGVYFSGSDLDYAREINSVTECALEKLGVHVANSVMLIQQEYHKGTRQQLKR